MSHHRETMRSTIARALELERARAPRLKERMTKAPEGDYRSDLERHLVQTYRHQRLLRRHLESLNGAPTSSLISTATTTATDLLARAYDIAQIPLRTLMGGEQEETILEGAQGEARTGAELIAAYLALERIAANIGEVDISHLARELHKEEEAMLARLGSHIPELANHEVPPTVSDVSEQASA